MAMKSWQGYRQLAVVTAYMRPDGVPDFTLTEVKVTDDEYANGVHYDLVEAQLGERGFEEPLIHFLCGQVNYVALGHEIASSMGESQPNTT